MKGPLHGTTGILNYTASPLKKCLDDVKKSKRQLFQEPLGKTKTVTLREKKKERKKNQMYIVQCYPVLFVSLQWHLRAL